MDVGALLRPRAVAAESQNTMGSGAGGMDMPGSQPQDPEMDMSGDTHRAMPATMFLTGWVAMMAAMMLPAIVPMVMLVARWSRSQAQPSYRLTAFVGGYLLIWSVTGALYYILIEVLSRSIPSTGTGVRIAASVLVLAGLYQLTPLKDRCLTACRTPLGFLMTHGGRMSTGTRGYIEVGARHGLFCLGCCWMLMVILILMGVMNIFWMLVVAGAIFVEKTAPFGAGFARLMGAGIMATGAVLVVVPELIA